jgi:PAS domain S-box-containing protein
MDAPLWVENAEILDLVHDSIIVRDMDGRIVQWNSAAEALYGWTRDEALGRSLHELLLCGDPALPAALEARLLADDSWEGELCRTTRDGAETWTDLRWSLQRDSAGRPTCIVETGRDVTARRAAEEAARVTEYRYRNLFQAMSVAFFEVDFAGVGALLLPLREGGIDLRQHLAAHPALVREAMRLARVVDVNDKTLALFGAGSRDEIVGGSVEPYWPDESLSVFAEALVETFEKKPHLITETRLRDLNGGALDVLFTVSWSPESRRRGILLL